MTKPISLKSLKSRVEHLEEALRQIEEWKMPYESYQWHWGFDGVKEYFQSIAKHGLHNTPIYIHPEPDIIENLKVFGFNKKVAESKG